MKSVSTIVVATDFSPTCQFAIDYAAGFAKMAGAKLLIAHVFELPSLDVGEGMLHSGVAGEDSATAERQLRATKPDVEDVEFERRFVRHSDAAEGLLTLARDESADLIVMGTNGRTGLMRVLMGSVAERVLREATCPVMTVKVPEALD